MNSAPAPVARPDDALRRTLWQTLKRTVLEVRDDQLTDRAAALTYYSMLSLFPGLIALVALIGLLGEHPRTTDALLGIISDIGPASAVQTFQGPIEEVIRSKGGAGALLGAGLLGALWSASGYVGAFMRAANVIYETEEGRPFWKLRPLQLLVTLVLVIGLALIAISLALTGPLARSVGDAIGVGDAAVTAWSIAKWPVLLAMVMAMLAGLFYVSPNVRLHRLRWLTPGGAVALITWAVTSAGFALYVANLGSYGATFGSLGGVVVLLLWLWLTNLALLFGLQFDAELERSREIQAGDLAALDEIQLMPREAAS